MYFFPIFAQKIISQKLKIILANSYIMFKQDLVTLGNTYLNMQDLKFHFLHSKEKIITFQILLFFSEMNFTPCSVYKVTLKRLFQHFMHNWPLLSVIMQYIIYKYHIEIIISI